MDGSPRPSHADLAERLRGAYYEGTVGPLRDGLDPTDEAGAYAVQRLNTQHWLEQGRRIAGRKIGLTAKSVQQQLGVDRPDYGALFADMEIEDGGVMTQADTIQPKAEAEVALVLERDIAGPEVTLTELTRAVAYAVPAIEVPDSRIADWQITFADTVADNASAGMYVLGTTPVSLSGLDLRLCGMVMRFDDTDVSFGVGGACLGNPLRAALWLARTLTARGETLKAGEVLLTGALGPMVAMRPGTIIEAEIGGLGRVGFRYEA